MARVFNPRSDRDFMRGLKTRATFAEEESFMSLRRRPETMKRAGRVAQPAMVAQFPARGEWRKLRNHGWLRYFFRGVVHIAAATP